MGATAGALAAVIAVVVMVAGCGTPPVRVGASSAPSTTTVTTSITPSATATTRKSAAPRPQPSPRPTAKPRPVRCTDSHRTWKGHRRFYTSDRTCYTSPWFSGTHRIMIGFGCNPSPWYPKARACHWKQGIHHGIDLDMAVGTTVRSAVAGTAHVRPSTMGPAYGRNGLIIRSGGRDFVLGHLSKLEVRNGQHVRAGQAVARSGMSGVEDEDGPHLHVEVRPAGGGYTTAVNPRTFLRLHARR